MILTILKAAEFGDLTTLCSFTTLCFVVKFIFEIPLWIIGVFITVAGKHTNQYNCNLVYKLEH